MVQAIGFAPLRQHEQTSARMSAKTAQTRTNSMNTTGHYRVIEADLRHYMLTRESVRGLVCCHCNFTVVPRNYRRYGDRSGLPRYARARGVMVKHLHAAHRALLAENVTVPAAPAIDYRSKEKNYEQL